MPIQEGGQRVMRTAAPEAFANVAAADRIATANREGVEACSKRVDKSLSTATCAIHSEHGKNNDRIERQDFQTVMTG